MINVFLTTLFWTLSNVKKCRWMTSFYSRLLYLLFSLMHQCQSDEEMKAVADLQSSKFRKANVRPLIMMTPLFMLCMVEPIWNCITFFTMISLSYSSRRKSQIPFQRRIHDFPDGRWQTQRRAPTLCNSVYEIAIIHKVKVYIKSTIQTFCIIILASFIATPLNRDALE